MGIGTWIKLAVAAGILVVLLRQGQLELDLTALDGRGWLWLFAGTLILIASCLVGFVRWWILVRGPDVTWARVLQLSWVSTFVNTVVPGGVGGDVLRGALLGGRWTRAQGLFSVAADRGVAIVALVLLTGVLLAVDAELLRAAPMYRWGLGFLMLLGVGLVGFWCLGPRLNDRVATWLAPLKRHPKRMLQALMLGFISHALTCVGLLFYHQALGSEVSWARLLSHLPAALALAGIPALPGGMGIGHLAFIAVLGLAGVQRGGDLYTLYALQLFLLAGLSIPSVIRLRIPFKELLRYNVGR